ncbi:glycosyltransferase family 2 protein, partial [Candidatus Falkowbacteria bacterium]|nr:glycosyltransferase family 2 protein [Candidatus Falkowbacteria bacterium]
MKAKVYCIIPALNEEKNIVPVIKSVLPVVDCVVVVDDGSKDNTAALSQDAGATVLRHVINRGQGAALRTGTRFAVQCCADIIVHFDADGQFLSEDIATVIAPIVRNEAQIVFGSRFLLKKSTNMPKAKEYLIMPLARLVNRLLFKVELTDPQSGFRAFTPEAFKKIAWQQDGMAHASEIRAKSVRSGFVVTEVPITVIYHHFGQKFSGGFKILKDLLIARL